MSQVGQSNYRTDGEMVVTLQNNTRGTLALTTTAAMTPDLKGGIYDLWCDVTCFVSVSSTVSTAVTAANGYVLFAGNVVTFLVNDLDHIESVVSAGTGTLNYHKVN